MLRSLIQYMFDYAFLYNILKRYNPVDTNLRFDYLIKNQETTSALYNRKTSLIRCMITLFHTTS